MKKVDDSFFFWVVDTLKTVSDDQLSQCHRDKCAEFDGSAAEAYDLLMEIAYNSCCGSSSFIKALCEVDKYYSRPV